MWGAGAPSLPFPFRAAHAPGCGDPFPHGRRVRFPPLSRRQEQVPLSLSEERYHSRQGKGNRVGEQNERANGRSLSDTSDHPRRTNPQPLLRAEDVHDRGVSVNTFVICSISPRQ